MEAPFACFILAQTVTAHCAKRALANRDLIRFWLLQTRLALSFSRAAAAKKNPLNEWNTLWRHPVECQMTQVTKTASN
jgi:hypothetical protein